MNKYGFFTYFDYPSDADGIVTTSYGMQENTTPIHSFSNVDPLLLFPRYASFEQGEFDFEKPLWETVDDKLPAISLAISDEDGEFEQVVTLVDVIPNDSYSGSGFSLRTFNSDYSVRIKVVDSNGTRQFEFEKTDDEFYPIPEGYSGLTNVTFTFLRVEPHHFINLIAYSFGAIRKLQESDFVEEPTITNHFSLTGEDLEYDTLDLTIRSDKQDFNVIRGEKLIYSETGQKFYVDSAKSSEDGTIEISCYDDVARLEEEFYGRYSKDKSTSTWITTVLKGTTDDITVEVNEMLDVNQNFSGILPQSSYREAAQMLLYGNALRVKRGKEYTFDVFCPQLRNIIPVSVPVFNDANLISVPEFELIEKYKTIKFISYHYLKDTTQGKVYAYYASVPKSTEEQILLFDEPFAIKLTDNSDIYYVSHYVDDEPVLVPISQLSGFTVVEKNYSYCKVINNSDAAYEIVIKGYPFKESQEILTAVDVTIPSVYKNNIKEINDCTVIKNGLTGNFMTFLKYVYSHNIIASFDSLLNVDAGDKVKIIYHDKTYTGWVITKTNNLNGLYNYEVACR